MKVATGNHSSVATEDQRMICNRVDLYFKDSPSEIEGFLSCPENLGRTSKRVRILRSNAVQNPVLDGSNHPTAFQQLAHSLRNANLARVWPELVNSLVEGVDPAIKAFKG